MRREPGSDPVNDPTLAHNPIHVVPATPEPVYDERPTAPVPVASYVEPGPIPVATYVEPAAPVAPAVVAPAAVVPPEPVYYAPPARNWGAIAAAALVALLIGGIVGVLIGRAGAKGDTLSSTDTATGDTTAVDQATLDKRVNDVFTLLVAESQQPGGISTPTPYPSLDQLLGILQSSATPTTSADTAATTAATEQATALNDQIAMLQQQNTTLQQQLTEAQQQRDELQATIDTASGATSDLQRKADEQAQQINDLQGQVTDLQAKITDLQGKLSDTQAQLATAQDTLKKLNPQQVGNLVGTDIAQVRNTAKTNGWTLIERVVDNTGAAPNTVTAQTPSSGTTIISGGVLYVEVAKKP